MPKFIKKQFVKIRFIPLLALVVILPSTGLLRAATPPQPGKYEDFHDVDQVTVLQTFQLANYHRILVAPLDTKGAALPAASDNSYAEVKAMLAHANDPFMAGLQEKIGRNIEVAKGRSGNALLVRARITKSEPGSQAARYFGGFGAGAAQVAVAGEIVDGKTGKTLVRFQQERRSGVGAFGGGYRELLERSLHQIGGDVAQMLRAF